MATFPTAEELQRPIPRIDGSVPTYQPAMTGEAGPRATYQAGQVIQSLGQDVGDFAQRLDAADAQDALNKFRQKRQELTYDPEKGFLRLKGRAALSKGPDGKSIMDTTSSALDTESEALSKNLSPRAAALFRARAINEAQSFKMDLVKHQMHESEKYEAAVYTDAQAGNLNRAALSAQDDRAIGIIAGQAGKLARQRAESLGMPGDAAAAGAQSDVLKAAVTMRIAKGDPSAIGFFEKHKDKFDAKDRIGLESSIKELSLNVQASGWMQSDGTAQGKLHSAIVTQESGNRQVDAKGNTLTSVDNAKGIGQITPGTFAQYAKPGESIDNKADNLRVSRRIIDDLSAKFNGDPARVAVGYFSGEGNVAPLGSPTPWKRDAKDGNGKSTSAYVADVMGRLGQVEQGSTGGATATIAKPGTPGPIAPRTITTDTGDVFLADYDPATGRMRAVPTPADTLGNGIATPRDLKIDAQQIYLERMEANARDNGNNPALFTKVKGMIEAEFAANKVKVQLYADQTWNQVQEHIAKGGPNGGPAVTMPPPHMMAAIKPELHDSIAKRIALNVEGKKVKTDLDVYGRIHDKLTSTDPHVRKLWSTVPMAMYASMLSEADVKHFMAMQGKLREDEGKFLTEVSVTQANALADKLDIRRGANASAADAKQYGAVVRLFQNELTLFETQKGEKADFKEVQAIEDSIIKKTATAGTFWDGETPVALLKWSDIPEDERRRAAAAIRKQGGTPTEDEVVDFIKHMRARAPVKALDRPWPAEWEGAGQDAGPTPAPPPPSDNRSVRDKYQDAMSVPSRDLATMGADALRRALGLEEDARIKNQSLYSLTFGFMGDPPTGDAGVKGEARFPDATEVENARRADATYGDPRGVFHDNPDATVSQARAGMIPRVMREGALDKVPEFKIGEADRGMADKLYAVHLAANRSAVASLGFDPKRFTFVPEIDGEPKLTHGGQYSPKKDRAWADMRSPEAAVHESIHRGVEMMRSKGLIASSLEEAKKTGKPYVAEEKEETLVRAMMLRYFGNIEEGRGDIAKKQVAEAKAALKNGWDKLIDEFEAVAAKEIARNRPRGPR